MGGSPKKWDSPTERNRASSKMHYVKLTAEEKKLRWWKCEYGKMGGTNEDHQNYIDETQCQCCGILFEGTKLKKCQDHDHLTNTLRGVICNSCNIIEGLVHSEQQLLDIYEYILKHRNK